MKPLLKPQNDWPLRAGLLLLVFLVFFSLPFLHGFISRDQGYGLASGREAPVFKLLNQAGSVISLSDFRGKFVYLMFGYLNCEDICHSQALLFQEINQMADMPAETQFLYIGMDPERDSPARLAAYFDQRGDNFSSLRAADMKSVQQLAGKYRAFFSPGRGIDAGDYEISHPGLFFLIDPDGRLRFIYTAGQTDTTLIVNDLRSLRKTKQQSLNTG